MSIQPNTSATSSPVVDLPPHSVRLARMIGCDCVAPGPYRVTIAIPHFPLVSVEIQTARVEVIRNSESDRK